MTTIRSFVRVAPLSMLCFSLVACATSMTAQKPETTNGTGHGPNLRTVIWRDPGRMASLNLIYGAGGKAHAPDPKGVFTFLTEDTDATSPKFEIADRHGVQWKVKRGQEPQSETAAARLLWAAGYFVDEDYYLPELTVIGMPTLQRGSEFVSAGGLVRGARLERKLRDVKKLGTWDWFDNPFTDTRELNGLRIMMALLNNWDLKESVQGWKRSPRRFLAPMRNGWGIDSHCCPTNRSATAFAPLAMHLTPSRSARRRCESESPSSPLCNQRLTQTGLLGDA